MFLSELYKYKKRMEADAASGMTPEGYSEENISFVLRIKPVGIYIIFLFGFIFIKLFV